MVLQEAASGGGNSLGVLLSIESEELKEKLIGEVKNAVAGGTQYWSEEDIDKVKNTADLFFDKWKEVQ